MTHHDNHTTTTTLHDTSAPCHVTQRPRKTHAMAPEPRTTSRGSQATRRTTDDDDDDDDNHIVVVIVYQTRTTRMASKRRMDYDEDTPSADHHETCQAPTTVKKRR
ncbi:uncharacterized protein LACBIDRAFT_305656 [Laccaria bicolor S238N-H82]|uniref:Predicted protein n=1 Tax=Laccaria bicolor (strain S238N-H82 / ATCC MYA-4686) TaxID=486041 RepID=B0CUR5_LACBS|nr:uncharacterized protein LACBIDRAFT_305656 [Laccaria bicolor S238N-H82]EDR14140.1 predicted protein [Laccaria bicolor S238N-H82]|eukprot:XP_001874699.1 predicted protein [Laccaria bicolor S238N-H82]